MKEEEAKIACSLNNKETLEQLQEFIVHIIKRHFSKYTVNEEGTKYFAEIIHKKAAERIRSFNENELKKGRTSKPVDYFSKSEDHKRLLSDLLHQVLEGR